MPESIIGDAWGLGSLFFYLGLWLWLRLLGPLLHHRELWLRGSGRGTLNSGLVLPLRLLDPTAESPRLIIVPQRVFQGVGRVVEGVVQDAQHLLLDVVGEPLSYRGRHLIVAQAGFGGRRGRRPLRLSPMNAMKSESSPAHEAVQGSLHAIKEIELQSIEAIESENYDDFGRLMDEHWTHKQRLSSRIAIPGIDELYREIKERFGVLGGKVSGAGGGGFFLVYAPGQHAALNEYMTRAGLERMHYRIEFDGAKIISQAAPSSVVMDHSPLT